MKKLLLGVLLLYSVNILEASSSEQMTVGYNPADFTIVGKSLPGSALTDMVVTGLHQSRCSNNSGRSYAVVASEDPRMMEVIEKEIEFSSGRYADPSGRLKSNIMKATHLVKGDATFENGSVSINLRVEDQQGCLNYQSKVSGSETDFYKLVDEAARSLGSKMCTRAPKVRNCPEPYYTATTTEKTSTKLKPIENYRGISKTLKSFEEDKDIYYMYVDTDKGKIDQLHVDPKSIRTIHKERYELNMKSCQYEVQSKDEVVKNMGGSPVLKSEDAGWGFEDDTKFYVDLPSTQKQLSFTWGKLRKSGHYSSHMTYKEKIPKIMKNMMGKVNDMATLFRNETKNSKEIETLKALYYYLGTPRDVQCGGKVAMESLLIPPLGGLQDPDVDFKINIRPSTKEEKKIMKAYKKRGF